MYKNIFKLACIPLVLSMFVLPTSTMAYGEAQQSKYNVNNSNNYYYASQNQQIDYLYSLIAQLQSQLSALQFNSNPSYQYNNNGNSSTRDISRVITGGVDSSDGDAVEMDGEVTFARDTEARVWFEYGFNTNLSYSTESMKINGDSGDTENFKIEATDLDDNKIYYYRAVAEDNNGNYAEGVIKSFRFDGRNNSDDDNEDDNYNDDNDNDWSLEIEDDSYEKGDAVQVEYEVDDEDNNNWIGLYEVGDSDASYVTRIYVDDEEGSVTFRINNEGEYEFRLFDEDGDEQAISDEFEIEN